MASNKNKREVQFELTNEDYRAFGRYRIMYTDQGHKMVRRQRITYLMMAVMLAALFTLFKVDHTFTIFMYAVAGILAVVGIFFAETLVLRQQDKAIQASEGDAERVHAGTNKIKFDEESFTTYAAGDEQTFRYSDIKLIDLTEEAIYVWMSDIMIMPLPLHAFRGMEEMKEQYKWLKAKNEEQGGKAAE